MQLRARPSHTWVRQLLRCGTIADASCPFGIMQRFFSSTRSPTDLEHSVRLAVPQVLPCPPYGATVTLGPGGFCVESRAEGQIPRTDTIIAYDSDAKVYREFYASSAGLVGGGTGTVNGNTWTWMLEDKVFGKAAKGRTTITILSASQYKSKYEMLDANGRYVTIVEGTSTKVVP